MNYRIVIHLIMLGVTPRAESTLYWISMVEVTGNSCKCDKWPRRLKACKMQILAVP